MTAKNLEEQHAAERIVLGAYRRLTGRSGRLLRYAVMADTPVGALGLAAGERGLARVDYVRDEDEFVLRLLNLYGDAPILRSALDEARRQLDRYFAGKSLAFDLPVDLSAASSFNRKVLRATARVPAGRFATYQEIAARAGAPRAMRAAGNALRENPVCIIIPCHRVIRSDGSLGGYGGGIAIKEFLLKHEGALGV